MRFRRAALAVGTVFTVLVFFGLLPDEWVGAKLMLTSLNNWIHNHAAYPALFIALLSCLVTIFLYFEAWPLLRDYAFPRKVAPDLNAREAFVSALANSKWAKINAARWQNLPALMYETGKPEIEIIEARLKQALTKKIHDELRKGNLVAFGRGGETMTEREILSNEWDQIALDFHRTDASNSNVCTWIVRPSPSCSDGIKYTQVHFCARQFNAMFR